MFTGIIEEMGMVRSMTRAGKNARICIDSRVCASGISIGDSISINGVCLTLTDRQDSALFFDVSSETLSLSNLVRLVPGDKVNLERALKQGGRIGGHFVTGHVDCVAEIISKVKKNDFVEFKISLPARFKAYLAQKGSIAIDGISLTVNNVSDANFTVMIIPHTLSVTTLGFKQKGDIVNLETDILAKYTLNLASKANDQVIPAPGLDRNFLTQHGFM
jgi:riboflavin synthase